MSMSAGDPLRLINQRVSLSETKNAIAAREPWHWFAVVEFLDELWRLCKEYRRDFSIYVALAVNETDWFRDRWWRERMNPAGIGITGVPSQDKLSPFFNNGKDAARCFFLLMEIKISRSVPESIESYAFIAREKTFETLALANLSDFPLVRELDDLRARFGPNNRECVWMCDQNGPAAIIEKASAIWPALGSSEGETNVSGLTPYPAIVERPLPDKFGAGMSWLARWQSDGSAVATWWHTMIGWLWSTDAYFRLAYIKAATDYGIGGAGDGAYDGVIFRWINYHERRFTSGWASGWDGAPDFDDQGAAFFAKFGASGVNPLGRSIEFSGLVNTPMTAKQWAAGIHLTAAIHHRELKQGWEEFLWNMHHREVAEKDCPFPRIYNFTTEYQKAIVLIMRHYETGFDIPEFATIAGLKVLLPGGMDPGPITPAPDKPIMISFPEKTGRVFHAAKNAKSRQWASTSSKLVREYAEDTRLRIVGYYLGESISGNDKWFVIKSSGPSNNARIHANGLKDEYIDPGQTAAGPA